MKIGIIGGIGPESTIDYYRHIIRLYQENGRGDYPDIALESINMTAMLKLVSEKDWDGLTSLLAKAVSALTKAGAGLAGIASNTPHIVFEQVQRVSPIPLVSIVEAARQEADRLALKKVGLLGTLFTMQGSYYASVFEKSGITVIVPDEKEQQYIEQKLFSEIEQGIFLEETRNGLLNIIKKMIAEASIDGVILGCTELPLILTESKYGIPFLNTTEIHVRRILEKAAEQGGTRSADTFPLNSSEGAADIILHPIGVIHSPYHSRKETPNWGASDPVTEGEIELDEQYLEGSADMHPGERYQVLFYFHKSGGYRLTVAKRGVGPMTGVFSTHAPDRPNAIGVSVITVTGVHGRLIRFTGVDMLEGTPVLDIKSYKGD